MQRWIVLLVRSSHFQSSYEIGPGLVILDHVTINNGGPNLAIKAPFLSVTLLLALTKSLSLAFILPTHLASQARLS